MPLRRTLAGLALLLGEVLSTAAAETPAAPRFMRSEEVPAGVDLAAALPVCAEKEFSDFLALSGVDFYPESWLSSDDKRTHLAVKDGNVYWTDASEFPLWKANFDARTVMPLAIRVDVPERVVTTSDAVWWIEENRILSGTCTVSRWLRRAALDGSGVTTVGRWGGCAAAPELLADDTSVYLLTSEFSPDRYVIRQVPRAGGPGVELAEADEYILSLAQDETFIYWTEIRPEDPLARVRRVPKGGGPAETLLDGYGFPTPGLARVGDELLFATVVGSGRNRIVTLPRAGGAPTVLLEIANDSARSKTVRDLATDGTHVYWLDNTALHAFPLAGGEATTLANVTLEGVGLTAAGGSVFWTESPNSVPGAIKRVPSEGGDVSTIVGDLHKPGRGLVAGTTLYWPEPGRIASVPLAGGATATVVSGLSDRFQPIATDGVNVYIGDGSSLKTVPVDGGRVEKLAAFGMFTHVRALAADGSFVYFVIDGSPARVAVGGGPVEYLTPRSSHYAYALAAAGPSVFWFELRNGEGEIKQVPKDGGPVTTLANGLEFLSDLVADADHVFFSSNDSGTISRMNVTGGGITTLGIGSFFSWNRLALGGSGVYWISQGSVLTVDKDGGRPSFVAFGLRSDVFFPDAVAADETHVYYTNVATGTIARKTLRRSTFSFEAARTTIGESKGLATVRVRRTGTLSGPASVAYAASDGTASAGSDYAPTAGTLSFGPRVSVQTFTLPVLDDTQAEGNETILLELQSPACGVLGMQDTAQLIISDDAVPSVELQAARYATREGRGSVSATVRRLGPSARRFMVDYATSDGTATAGQDYTEVTGTLLFEPGVVLRTINIPIADDAVLDPDETILLKLSNPRAPAAELALGRVAQATITIGDNDQGLQLSATRYAVGEASRRAVMTVRRTGGTVGRVTVGYAATGGTATNGVDYTLPPGTLTFASGQASTTFSVTLHSDTDVEGNETVDLALHDAMGATIEGPNPIVLTIADSPPSFQFRAAAYTAAEGAAKAVVVVERTGPLTTQATVEYQVTGGTAWPGADYAAMTSGTLTFPAGQATRTVVIAATDDGLDEPAETITLALRSASTGYGIGAPDTTVVTINDNDIPSIFQFALAGYSVSEGNSTATLTVTRSGGTGGAVTVHCSTSDGTAVAGTNYVPTSATLTFGPGETSKPFVVETIDDGVPEGNRFLNLTLSDPGAGSSLGAAATAVLWVVDRQ